MQIRASHILVPNVGDAILLKQQIDGGASFEDLAKQHSKCPSGKQGGDLGFFGPGRMVPAFDTAARALTVGQVSGPVVTQFGHHLIERTA